MIDIIIPTCKSLDSIQHLIAEINSTATGDYRVIPISSNDSAASNRNKGLEKSTASYIIMVDDDVSGFEKGWNEKLVKQLKDNILVNVVSARLMKSDKTAGIMCHATYEPNVEIQAITVVPTACVAFRRTAIRFDETFVGSGFEDNDWCNQLKNKCLIDNTVKVVHKNEAKNQSGEIWNKNKKYYETKWGNDFKFVAIYKTLLGGEWIESSLSSVYNYVDKIVIVHGTNMWGHIDSHHNNCIETVKRWKETHDTENKTIEINGMFNRQHEQYSIGCAAGKHLFDSKFLYGIIIDTDEIWDSINIQRLKGSIINSPEYSSYHCRMHTYIKYLFYRISPQESARPVVAINMKTVDVSDLSKYGARFMSLTPALFLDDIAFHHFTMVRRNIEDIRNKMIYNKVEENIAIDDKWLDTIWKQLPYSKDFHYDNRHKTSWKEIKVIGEDELPYTVRNNSNLDLYSF